MNDMIERLLLKESQAITTLSALEERKRPSGDDRTVLKPRRQAGLLSRLSAGREIARMVDARQRTPAERVACRLIYPEMPDRQVCNVFRRLRTTLCKRIGTTNFVLSVAAVTAAGGASFVARNLAAAIAFDETKTALLIDCNLRRPALGDLVMATGDEAPTGLTDYLYDYRLTADKIIHATGISRLRVIPVGRHCHAVKEFFTAPRLYGLIEELQQRYPERCIILDSPAMNDPDALLLSGLYDHLLLVVPYGRVTENQVVAAVLETDPRQLIGTVMNNVPTA